MATIGDEIARLRSRLLKRMECLMARYYFDTRDGDVIRDDTGIECEDLHQVLAEATSGLADFARDAIPGAKWGELAVLVRDEQDKLVMRATLRLQIDYAA